MKRIIIILISLALFFGGVYWLYDGHKFRQEAEEVTAEIVDIQVEHRTGKSSAHYVYINYTFGDKTFESVPLGQYDSTMYVGKEITVLVNPEEPGQIKTTSGIYIAGILLMVMGAVFMFFAFLPNSRRTVVVYRYKCCRQRYDTHFANCLIGQKGPWSIHNSVDLLFSL